MTETENIVKISVDALKDKKADNIKVIDISKISIMADYFIIADGSNINQLKAMCDNVEEKLAMAGIHPKQKEGYDNGGWILMDYRDVVIHIFDKENREFYNLERIWSDGKNVAI
ncbi:MAG: ribosome silencing factor [Lachnospiraceae bacterium]|nr:ribosome silencing factor [Lachnospiraceae bacterium]